MRFMERFAMPAEDPHSMTQSAGIQRTAGRMDAGSRLNHARASDPAPGGYQAHGRAAGRREAGGVRTLGEWTGAEAGMHTGVHTEMHTRRRLCRQIKECVWVTDP